VVIKMVDRAAKGPQVIVSRGDASLVQRLFEMEVPKFTMARCRSGLRRGKRASARKWR